MHFCGEYGRIRGESGGDDVYALGFQTENETVVRKGFTLLKKTYNIETGTALKEREMQELLAKVGDLERPVSPDRKSVV